MKKLIAFIMASVVFVAINASPVAPDIAKTVGYNFLASKMASYKLGSPSNLKLYYESVTNSGTACFYVFDLVGSKGFVIVSADDAIEPILGYSAESNYDTTIKKKMPVQLIDWLNNYSKRIAYCIQHKINATVATRNLWEQWKTYSPASKKQLFGTPNSVPPLVQTTWDQSPDNITTGPYNALCPYDSNYGARCVTGCVATAMAQVMKYWNYPAKGYGQNAYTPSTYYYLGTQYANFGNTTYLWNEMPDSLSASDSAVKINAVATLMYDCGVSVNMNYGVDAVGGSSATIINNGGGYNNAQEAFVNNFGYDIGVQGLMRSNYPDATWIGMLENELNAGRPFLYTGNGSDGGHCFVADGYDNNNFFHFNWGWGGYFDGFFSIDNLNTPYGVFDDNQQALIGIQPHITYTNTANVSDSLALVAMYNSTGGTHWTNNNGWLKTPVASWYGIKLDSTGRVVSIQLPNNNLNGYLPTAVAALINLKDLEVGGNLLSGNVPLALDTLANLTYLDISNNNYTFAGTESLGINLLSNTNLQVNYVPQANIPLYQKGNKFWVSAGGTQSAIDYYWFVNGNYLTTIYGDSTFTATLPGTYTVEAYDSLISMYLISATDTANLYVKANKNDSLAMVDLYKSTNGPGWANNTGWLQAPLGLWNGLAIDATGKVTTVNLYGNDLNGTVPSSFGTLTNLSYLELGSNKLRGNLTLSPKVTQKLNYADLEYNYYTFSTLEPLQNQLNADTALSFGYNFSYIPQDTLVPIHRSGNKLWVSTGGTSSQVTYTWYLNGVAVAINTGDSTLTATADGSYTMQANDALLGLLNLNSDTLTLNDVYVKANNIDSLALVDLYNSTNGPNWTNNAGWLKGPVSTWYGVYLDTTGRVKSLGLYGNNLTGTLPNSVGNLSNTTFLDFYNNNITGNIPASLGNLRNVTFMQLGTNQFSGTVPVSLGTLSKLTFIDVSSNNFTFGGLEPIVEKVASNASLSFNDDPQANVPLAQNGKQLSVSMGGSPNAVTYYWFLNGALIATNYDSTLTISAPGVYSVTATDSIINTLLPSAYLSLNSTLDTFIIKANTTDSLALVALYNSTNGSKWYTNSGWLQGPVCTWFGITLDSNGRVSSISLSSNNLNGYLPSALNNLSLLTYLELGQNNLSGYIPLNQTLLNQLTYLDLSNNSYTFVGLEPIANALVGNSTVIFLYAPQSYIPIYETGNSLWVSVGGTPSYVNYNWYSSGIYGPTYLETIYADSNYAPTASGYYYVVANDSLLPQLSLTSKLDTFASTLPVVISSFTAKAANNKSLLNWHTATELNTSHFNIQHCTDGVSFTGIGTIKAIGNGANNYSFIDNTPASGINYYRLESVDRNGAVSYSKIVAVQFSTYNPQLSIYPNPVKDVLTIGGNHIASVQVIDNLGRIIKVISFNDATNPTISMNELAKGVYHLRVATTDGKVNNQTIMVN